MSQVFTSSALEGDIALVTGASRGIGAAICRALKDAGNSVAASYAGNDEAAQRFSDETGIPAYKWDVSDFQACQDGVAKVAAERRQRDNVRGGVVAKRVVRSGLKRCFAAR